MIKDYYCTNFLTNNFKKFVCPYVCYTFFWTNINIWLYICLILSIKEREGTLGEFMTLVPKVLWLCVLIVGFTLNLNFNRMGNFVYHHWGCSSIFQSLSYPFRSLSSCANESKMWFWIFKTALETANGKTPKSKLFKHCRRFFSLLK